MNTIRRLCLTKLAAICVLGAPAFGDELLFSDDFEGPAPEGWTFAVQKAQTTDAKALSGRQSLHIPYDVPAGPPAHRDNNRFVEIDMGRHELDAFYVKGCFQLASTDTPTAFRKLFYIFSSPHDIPRWDIMVSANGGVGSEPLSLSFSSNYYDYATFRHPVWELARGQINFDQWHCLDLRVYLNTPGQRDGSVRLSVDNQVILERQEVVWRIDEKPLGIVRVGAQIDRNGDELVRHEDRYWDSVEIGSLPVAAVPKAPKEVSVQ